MSLFDKAAETYDEWCNTPIGSFVDNLEKHLIEKAAQPEYGEHVLDIGCGTGNYSIWFAEKGLSVTGIDLSSEMLNQARTKALHLTNIRFTEGDIHKLPYDDNQFDLIVCNIVLEFVASPEQVISEGLRVVKRGGRLVVGLIGKQSDWARKYEKRGKENPESIFSSARFLSVHDIEQFHIGKPTFLFGLYVSPAEFVSAKQAGKLEVMRSESQLETGAGFIAVRWEKNSPL